MCIHLRFATLQLTIASLHTHNSFSFLLLSAFAHSIFPSPFFFFFFTPQFSSKSSTNLKEDVPSSVLHGRTKKRAHRNSELRTSTQVQTSSSYTQSAPASPPAPNGSHEVPLPPHGTFPDVGGISGVEEQRPGSGDGKSGGSHAPSHCKTPLPAEGAVTAKHSKKNLLALPLSKVAMVCCVHLSFFLSLPIFVFPCSFEYIGE